MRSKRTVAGCVCLLFLGALAGCGGGTGVGQDGEATLETTVGESTAVVTTPAVATGETTLAEGPISTIQVEETEMSLNPDEIILDRPGTYVFRAVNTGNVVHSLRIEGNGIEEAATRDIGPGESADLQVDLRAGTYEMDCPVDDHEDLGMRGTITVGEG